MNRQGISKNFIQFYETDFGAIEIPKRFYSGLGYERKRVKISCECNNCDGHWVKRKNLIVKNKNLKDYIQRKEKELERQYEKT